MKANKSLKSKYPDKLYVLCNNNKILDISYAPQTMEAVEYFRADTFINNVCEWLQNNLIKELSIISSGVLHINASNVIKELKEAMEE